MNLSNLVGSTGFRRNVFLLAGGTTIAQGITILVTPLLTRLYMPDDFGAFAVLWAGVGILSAVSSLRFELALPLAESREDAFNLLAISTFLVMVCSFLIWYMVAMAGTFILQIVSTPLLNPYLWLLPLGVLFVGLYNVLTYWHIRHKTFARIAAARPFQSIVQVIVQATTALWHGGPLGLISGQLGGQLTGCCLLARDVIRQYSSHGHVVTLKGIKKVIFRFKRFPLYGSGSAFINTAGQHIPVLLMASFYGSSAAGWFILCHKLMSLPSQLVGQAVSQVYFGEAAGYESDRLRRLFRKTVVTLFLAGLPVAILCIWGGEWLFPAILGAEWLEAGKFVRFLAFMYLVQFSVSPVSQTLNMLERQDLQLAWDAGRLAVVVTSLALPAFMGLGPLSAVAFFSAGMTIMYALLVLLCLAAISRRGKEKVING